MGVLLESSTVIPPLGIVRILKSCALGSSLTRTHNQRSMTTVMLSLPQNQQTTYQCKIGLHSQPVPVFSWRSGGGDVMYCGLLDV